MATSISRAPKKQSLSLGPGGYIRAPKLSHVVAERLRAQIAAGILKLGDTLPAERDLLSQLGVSRPTLREALRVLESEGLIRLGRGARSGAMVLGPSIDTAARYGALYLACHGTTLGEIHQVRMLLEPPLVSLLAAREKKDFLRSLERYVNAQRAALNAEDYAAAITAIDEFHGQMLEFSENRALSLLMGMLQGFPAAGYSKFLLTGGESVTKALKQRTVKSTESHEQLVNLMIVGKPAQAEAFWRRYMEETADFLARTRIGKFRVELQGWPQRGSTPG
ncbi:MAG TPA: GntR family transcriptional regulator [Steroidobacteraceae bacterium]|jgi:DNA-binding FadR family transcriptional regulator